MSSTVSTATITSNGVSTEEHDLFKIKVSVTARWRNYDFRSSRDPIGRLSIIRGHSEAPGSRLANIQILETTN